MTSPDELQAQMTEWRRDFHRHPEFGFEKSRSAAGVTGKLRSFGIELPKGLAAAASSER
jgi:hippurate hydrolase